MKIMREDEIPETIHLGRWRTYLWILVAATFFSSYTTLELLKFGFEIRMSPIVMQALIIPTLFLAAAWGLWVRVFGLNYSGNQPNRGFANEDYYYITRKYVRSYRMLDMIIAVHFISILLSGFFFLFSLTGF